MPQFVSDGEERGDCAPAVAANPADLRAAPRHALLIRSAKLVVGSCEYLCILRDASDTGVSLKLFHDLPASKFMALELQNEQRHDVELVWHDKDRMGLRFVQPIDVTRLIEMSEPYPRRPIRVRLNMPGVIGVGQDTATCMIRDLSQHGAKIACNKAFAMDQRVGLVAKGMPRVLGKVRWRREEQLGLAFETTFQLAELAGIVADFHRSSAAATPVQVMPIS